MPYSNRIVSIPAGKCPLKLNSTKKEDVLEWAEEVISIGLKNNINYLPSALIFFAQQFFNIFSEDYKSICNHINLSYNTGHAEFDNLISQILVEKKVSDKEKMERKEKIEKEEKQKEIRKAKEFKKPLEVVEIKNIEQPKKKISIRRK
jgi:hypothetical protein